MNANKCLLELRKRDRIDRRCGLNKSFTNRMEGKGLLGSLADHYIASPSEDRNLVGLFGCPAYRPRSLCNQFLPCPAERAKFAHLVGQASRVLCRPDRAKRGNPVVETSSGHLVLPNRTDRFFGFLKKFGSQKISTNRFFKKHGTDQVRYRFCSK